MLRKLAVITLCISSLAIASENKPAISTRNASACSGIAAACHNPVMTCIPTPFTTSIAIGTMAYIAGKYFYSNSTQQPAPKKA